MVLVSLKEDTILIHQKDNRLLASHALEHAKGKIVINSQHRRNQSGKINELQQELCRLFSDQQMAQLFLEMIRNRFPRYPRDQFQHILKTINGTSRELIDKALEYCVMHHLFSSGEFHDVLQSFGKSTACKRAVVLKAFQPKTPLGDLDAIMSLIPESSSINAYEQLMN